MAKTKQNAAANEMQSLFDPQSYENIVQTWAQMNMRVTDMMVNAVSKSTEIASGTTQDALDNIREAAQVRDEPADYGQAYADLAKKQMELFMRSAQSFADVTQKTVTDAADVASETGQTVADKAASNAKTAADTASSAAKKAA